ncbi:MAG TPA: asparagine synthase (glutamine-hydrolyzing) [Burkholderiales bacterium]|nr:asparagine synthase (glutamine-hydrolyzing) [Burkholderiales bacterium]
MGAIAGWIATHSRAPDAAALVPSLEALAHRGNGGGADSAGIFTYRAESGHCVVLGQSHYDPNSEIALVLDGVIANRLELGKRLAARGHASEDESCAQLLARAYERWDKEVVHQLRGAFAFALWDARKERLMLARDRFGEKPLYLYEQAGALHFASQIKALAKGPGVRAQPDPGAVRDYLAYRYVPGPRTVLSGVRKLTPGSYALWQFGRLREVRYWVSPDGRTAAPTQVGEPVAAFTEKLDEAVRERLPAGILLSGGIDSAMLVALAAKHQKVKTFSAGFADDAASELARAAQVAKRFGTEHHEIVLSPRDVLARLPQAVAERDAPVSRPADVALYFMAAEVARQGGAPAVLTGDGADEVLGGYRRHVAERHWGLRSVPTLLLLAAPLAGRRPRLRAALASLRTRDWRERCVRWIGAERNGLLGKALVPPAAGQPPFYADPGASSLRRALYFDQSTWLPDNVLERTDRMTMAASLEARAPFLDHRLVELVSALPDDLRVRGFATKWILRQAARPLLAGLALRKTGFRIPVGAWLRGELREFLLEHLRGPRSVTRPYYEAKILDRLLDEHLAGRRNHEELLWTLLNLEIWLRAWRPA